MKNVGRNRVKLVHPTEILDPLYSNLETARKKKKQQPLHPKPRKVRQSRVKARVADPSGGLPSSGSDLRLKTGSDPT